MFRIQWSLDILTLLHVSLLNTTEMHLRAELQNQVRAEVQERPQEVLPLQARVPERPHQEMQYQVHEKVWGGEWFIRMKHENPFVSFECNW